MRFHTHPQIFFLLPSAKTNREKFATHQASIVACSRMRRNTTDRLVCRSSAGSDAADLTALCRDEIRDLIVFHTFNYCGHYFFKLIPSKNFVHSKYNIKTL